MIPDESTPRFTPGPWAMSVHPPMRDPALKRQHWRIGTLAPGEGLKGIAIAFGDDDADARLIAAAPALYEACRMVHQVGLTPAVKRQVVSALILAEEGGGS